VRIAFWLSIATILYTFAGYGILLYGILSVRRIFRAQTPNRAISDAALPSLTLIVAAYNEADIISSKIRNTVALAYPPEKLRLLFISDGSNDGTDTIIAEHAGLNLMHMPERGGKINAIHRAMASVTSDIVVFTDANTFLNADALRFIARHYQDPAVGAVSGEKRVQSEASSDATAGEGFYWKYESALKRWDSELNSVVGAAGELFSIRTACYAPVPADTVLDDFMISMRIAEQGYRIVYEPDAFATEGASATIGEEWKRKVRIAAGGIQAIGRLRKLLNPFHQPLLTFQYISHRVLRWTVTPLLLPLTLALNALLVAGGAGSGYTTLLVLQCLFYLLALAGCILSARQIKLKIAFIPCYFSMMNAAVICGMFRYFTRPGKQSVLWEKALRKDQKALLPNP
jgi:biofilm PGA synthesis N-glycosyltransferase PgaC